ncbi:MAG: U32 family peptidase [Paludibacteraceae bacterium]|nr:U32 family peptidase [Paludibacteraceae bacterium]
MRTLELLAPAKDTQIAREAIVHGADAVYIGAPKFGARAAAGNTINELAELVTFAHQYRAKVYITLNTILTDQELTEAKQIIAQLYKIGADALIVQDMGLFELDLPPIALHASTQCDNRTPEKVKFLEDIGCEQVVLARELSVDEIKRIRETTSVRLETFVHGALCVSYSGQCYAGQALMGRSANRGVCPQICRLPFDLQDAHGHSLGKKHWLSLKDFDTHHSIEELIEAGADSFKIEGRLKDMGYVKNITALYSEALDRYIATHQGFRRSSDGVSRHTFVPAPEKSFNRMGTDYFLHGRHRGILNPISSKSMGEIIGPIKRIGSNWIEVDTDKALANGDGFCHLESGQLTGFRANRADGCRLYPDKMPQIAVGTLLYRNEDTAFNRLMATDTAIRKIPVTWHLTQKTLSLSDEAESVSMILNTNDEIAQKDQSGYIRSQLKKLGDTIYEAVAVNIDTPYFFPASILGEARRQLAKQLTAQRAKRLPAPACLPKKNEILLVNPPQGYRSNIHNEYAKAFYQRHGVTDTMRSFESAPVNDVPVMFCKHCIKYELGACSKLSKDQRREIEEPLHLIYGNYYLRLKFDCAHCEMQIIKE